MAGNRNNDNLCVLNLSHNRYAGRWNRAIGMENKKTKIAGMGAVIILAVTNVHAIINAITKDNLVLMPLVIDK
jgi:hypothetical protein